LPPTHWETIQLNIKSSSRHSGYVQKSLDISSKNYDKMYLSWKGVTRLAETEINNTRKSGPGLTTFFSLLTPCINLLLLAMVF
jgi:hypothetical protein